MRTADVLKANRMLKDEVFLTIHKNDEIKQNHISCRQSTKPCTIPESDEIEWWVRYRPAAVSFNNENTTNPIRISLGFSSPVKGRVTVEAHGLPTKTYVLFPSSEYFERVYLPHKDVYAAINRELEIKIAIDVCGKAGFVPEIRRDFHAYTKIPSDFVVQCGENQIKVHNDVLSKISPFFEAMLRHNFVEKSCNKLEINDFDFKTIETAMNIIYGRPCGKLFVEMVLEILYFADKYHIADIFDQLEKQLPQSISTANFYAVLRYADHFGKTNLFSRCAEFYEQNHTRNFKNITLLPIELIIKMWKSAFYIETVFDILPHAYHIKLCISVDLTELPEMTTLDDFFNTVPYAWEYPQENLKMTCVKFWRENKDNIRESPKYQKLSKTIQHSLILLGRCFKMQTRFHRYEKVPTDFTIQCGDNQIKVHKEVLSEISPVLEAMLHHNFVETTSNKLEISDFDFKTVETAMNICYGRPWCDHRSILFFELVLDVLYFADKYQITDILTQLEEMPTHNLFPTNFCSVLRCADQLGNTRFFKECASFFKLNEDKINATKEFTKLPGPLVVKLYNIAYQFENHLDAFWQARDNGNYLYFQQTEVTMLGRFC